MALKKFNWKDKGVEHREKIKLECQFTMFELQLLETPWYDTIKK